MPRARKPAPGANRTDLQQVAQIPTAPTGMPYGAHQASIGAQQAMPVPDLTAPAPEAMTPGVAAAQAYDFQPVGLGDPSASPDEPITAGLSSGPGPGPEAIVGEPTGRVTAVLRRLAAVSSDPTLLALADEAESQGI